MPRTGWVPTSLFTSRSRALDRRQIRVSAATSLREKPGASAPRTLEAIPDLTLLTLNLGRPIGQFRGLARAAAVVHNLRGMASLVGLARWCRANRVDEIHVTERPRQALFGLLVARMGRQRMLDSRPHDPLPARRVPIRQLAIGSGRRSRRRLRLRGPLISTTRQGAGKTASSQYTTPSMAMSVDQTEPVLGV